MHQKDQLKLSKSQKDLFKLDHVQDIFPLNYIIRVDQFNEDVKDTLDEWIYFFKKAQIKDDFTAKNISKAKEKLDVLNLDEKERRDYENYIDMIRYHKSVINTAIIEGREEERKKGKQDIAVKMFKEGLDTKLIAKITGLSKSELERIKDTFL